jgi:photosystem II stability/assembly factor-like uncharacterized protein
MSFLKISACVAALLLASGGYRVSTGQEKLRVDNETVAVVDSPWIDQEVVTDADLRGLSVVNSKVVWASGTDGTIVYTADGGLTWSVRKVDHDPDYDFRDIEGIDDATAIVINSGNPAEILRTTNGGLRWKTVLKYPVKDNKAAFFNSVSFWDDQRGIAMSDPVDGSVLLLRTKDGGVTWKQLRSKHRPPVELGETGFAASGTNMQTRGRNSVYIGLGGGKNGEVKDSSRLLISRDFCKTWSVGVLPLKRTKTSGIFSVHFFNDDDGVAVGGDYQNEDSTESNYAFTSNGGASWAVPAVREPPSGFRTCLAQYVSGKEIGLVAVGPNGTDLSTDLGHKWRRISGKGFNVVRFSPDGKHGWAAGADGRIAKWKMPKVKKKPEHKPKVKPEAKGS